MLPLLLLLVSISAFASMSVATAMTKAVAIWGTKAELGRQQNKTDQYETYQVGYLDDYGNFVVIGSGLRTWDAAFKAIPAGYTPPVTHVVQAKAYWYTAEGIVSKWSDPVTVHACNAPCVIGTITRRPLLTVVK